MSKQRRRAATTLNRLWFYISSFAGYYAPGVCFRRSLEGKFRGLSDEERETILRRTAYYIRLGGAPRQESEAPLRTARTTVGDYRFPFGQKNKHSRYFFDLYRNTRYFDPQLQLSYLFGDVTRIPDEPTIVKSRPITDGPLNSVVMKLNSVRHFRFVSDRLPFDQKKDLIVSRNVVRQPQRELFLERHIGNPRCDIGKVNSDWGNPAWVRPYMSIDEQLHYKFVACIEGHDVATNLKWVMSSNSLAVMPRPRFETWFMEGTLKPGEHFVEVRDDYADLDDKMDYYLSHPREAKELIANANRYTEQFKNRRMERLIELNVLNEYFKQTGQTDRSLL